jgi:hypothetical protein
MNACSETRDAFWNMLVSHVDLVRAVFVGYTHVYSRMRVLDPASDESNDPSLYPDQPGGIWQVDCGACGNGDERSTIIRVEIDGGEVRMRVLDAANGMFGTYEVIDDFVI